MTVVLSTADVPPREKFDYWQDMLDRQAMPISVQTDRVRFSARIHAADFGVVRTLLTENTPVEVKRTPALIRRSDPESFYLIFNRRGRVVMSQERRSAVLGPGDLTLLHSSRTSTSTADPSDAYQQGGVVMFDASAVPIPPARLDQLIGVRLPADDGLVSLVVGHQCSLGSGTFHPDDAARLAAVTVDLLTVLFARQLAGIETLPAATRANALLAQIRSCALARLGDPTLTPAVLAATHHISVRTLHRLFRSDNTTVAAWIRQHRLDACRRGLVNPALADRSVQSIAARWGFTNAAHFSRLFKATYGQTAAEYRQRPGEAGTDRQ